MAHRKHCEREGRGRWSAAKMSLGSTDTATTCAESEIGFQILVTRQRAEVAVNRKFFVDSEQPVVDDCSWS